MFNIPNNATILADAKLHLPLYDKIIQSKGNTLSIKVMSLEAFISPFYPDDLDKPLEILYQYKNKLNSLSKENAFYSSKEDPNFLKACLEYITWAAAFDFDLQNSKNTTQKEKDLKEILDLIKDIPLKEHYTSKILDTLKEKNFSNIYILKRIFTDTEYIWIKFLIEHNAQFLDDPFLVQKHYYACSNARTQAAIVAKKIIENDMDADNIQIAVSNQSDTQVLCQMFDHYKIPYTLLSKQIPCELIHQFMVGFNWLQDKSLNNLIELSKYIYHDDLIKKYFALFPFAYKNDFSIASLEYKENSIIDEYSFQTYQELEKHTTSWMNEHKEIFDWTQENIIEMINEIKSHHENLSSQDLSILKKIIDLIIQAKPYIKTPEDLQLLIDALNNLNQSIAPETYQGVLIGTIKDITALKDIVFLLSADASNLNVLSLKNGIFDEAYIQDTDLPDLRSRIDFQTKQLYETLDLARELYVIVPQSTYQSKNLEKNMQIDTYMDMDCKFISVKEHSIFKKPQFELDRDTARKLYLKHDTFTGSISRLEAFVSCPLKHFIRYGLYLRETKDMEDIRVRGTILHHILETLTKTHKKAYASIEDEEILNVVQKEFQFVKTCFPNKIKWADAQIKEVYEKIKLILEQLAYFENNWHMDIHKQEQKFSFVIPWQDMTIELYGYVDRIDTSTTSFCIFDYKSSDKDLNLKDFKTGKALQLATYTIAVNQQTGLIPVGSFYISLKSSPVSQNALKLTYKKKIPESKQEEVSEQLIKFEQGKKLKGWAYQDISIYCEDPSLFSTKKDTPSYPELKQMHSKIITNITEDILSGNIYPNHDKDACQYCQYRMICRNARNEITLSERINKEDE